MRGVARDTFRDSIPGPSYTGSRLSRCRMMSRSFSWSIYLALSYRLLLGTPQVEPRSRGPRAQFAARAEGVLVDVEVRLDVRVHGSGLVVHARPGYLLDPRND
jgi:hypothetical protein